MPLVRSWLVCFDGETAAKRLGEVLEKLAPVGRPVRICARRVASGVRHMCLTVDVWTAHDWVEREVCLDHGRVIRRMCTRATGCVDYSETVECGEYLDLLQRFVELDRPESFEEFLRFLDSFYLL